MLAMCRPGAHNLTAIAPTSFSEGCVGGTMRSSMCPQTGLCIAAVQSIFSPAWVLALHI